MGSGTVANWLQSYTPISERGAVPAPEVTEESYPLGDRLGRHHLQPQKSGLADSRRERIADLASD